jgi:photosystem II stability/assembly factor-like uncharacterized protein
MQIATWLFAAALSWRILGPGGGGAMFLPTVSPHDPKDVVLRCDMTGAYISRDGGDSWRMFNLRGVVRFFAFHPKDKRTIYAGTRALWRSTDFGATWQMIWPARVDRIAMDNDHADERFIVPGGGSPAITALSFEADDLYAGISEGGKHWLARSADGGKSWTNVTELPDAARRILGSTRVIGTTAVTALSGGQWKRFPMPPGVTDVSAGTAKPVIYAITESAIHTSEDGGATWRETTIGKDARYRAVATSEGHPDTVYVSYNRLDGRYFGVAKSTNAGRDWQLVWKESREPGANIHDAWITARFGPGWGENPINLGVDRNDPNRCFGTDFGRTMRTTDGGKTWRAVYSRKQGEGWTSTGLDVTTAYGVHWDPFDAKRMFISYTDIGLFRSEDSGKTWLSSSDGVPREWVNTTYWMEFDPEVRGRVWAVMSGTHDLPRPKMWRQSGVSRYRGGVAMSDDGGRTWRTSTDGMPPTAPTHIVLDPKSPKEARTLYVAAFGRGVYKSVDGGKTWALKNKGIAGDEPFAWRLTRLHDGTLYLVLARRSEAQAGALYKSMDGAESWTPVALPADVTFPNGLSVDPRNPKRLYLAAWHPNGGVYVSDDAGGKWRRTLSEDSHVYDVTVDLRNPDVLYACGFTSSAWRSTDRGQTWSRLPGYDFKWGHRVIPDPRDPRRLYITTFGGSVWHQSYSASR